MHTQKSITIIYSVVHMQYYRPNGPSTTQIWIYISTCLDNTAMCNDQCCLQTVGSLQ